MERTCDVEALKNSIVGEAGTRVFSWSSIIPIAGPSLEQFSWASCPIGDPNCKKSLKKSLEEEIQENRGQLQELTGQWQKKITEVVSRQSSQMKQLLQDLPAIIQSKLDYALEPITENLILLGVQIAFISIILFCVVSSYS
jgi:hypothetical protein